MVQPFRGVGTDKRAPEHQILRERMEREMRKVEFIALGVSEELAAKAEAASLKELEGYVEESKHDDV